MPVTCKFQLNNGAIGENDGVTFDEFIDASFGLFHKDPVKIARVSFNGRPAFIYSTCPCIPAEKGKLSSGQFINDETVIGYFSAQGKDIPYDKPYATIRFE